MNYSGLNHTEFLTEKIILLVSLDNNQTIKTVPLGVGFQFWVGLNVSCSYKLPNGEEERIHQRESNLCSKLHQDFAADE